MVLLQNGGRMVRVHCEGWSVGEPHVILEMSQLSKTFATNFAGERFLSSMNQLMSLQLGRRWEFFSTVSTLMATIVSCCAGTSRVSIRPGGWQLHVEW